MRVRRHPDPSSDWWISVNPNPVSPPNLPTDTPVTQVIDPMEIYFREAFRDDSNLTRADCLMSKLFQTFTSFWDYFVDINKPLLGNKRLNWSIATIADRQVMFVMFIDMID
jgi:hypothetical protein